MLNYDKLPERLRGGAQRYIEHGIQPGDFLTAVIDNNLKESVSRADDDMIKRLLEIVSWWYWEAPAGCWGSKEKRLAWMKARYEEHKK